jgi:hypothetical protein
MQRDPFNDWRVPRASRSRSRLLMAVSLGLAMTLAVAGCDRIGNVLNTFAQAASDAVAKPACETDVAEWNEEVKLHDGQMVTVWRKATACKWGFPNAKRGRDIEFEFKYPPMNVQWKGAWNRDPVSFEIFDGVPHLALYIGDRESCRKKLPTDYTVQFLRWVDGRWVEVPQAQFPVDRALMNLSEDYWGHTAKDDFKGLIRWDNKRLYGGYKQQHPDTIKSYFERGQRFCREYLSN